MRIKEGFILRKVGKQYVVAATGEASKAFNGMIRMNEASAHIFKLLQEETTAEALVNAMITELGADEATARADIEMFLGKLKEAGALA